MQLGLILGLALLAAGAIGAAWGGVSNSGPGVFFPRDTIVLTDETNSNSLLDETNAKTLVTE